MTESEKLELTYEVAYAAREITSGLESIRDLEDILKHNCNSECERKCLEKDGSHEEIQEEITQTRCDLFEQAKDLLGLAQKILTSCPEPS